MLILFFVGLISSLVPNIPLVVAMVPLIPQYVINTGMAPVNILDATYQGQLPPEILPLFYAMMYGATLDGNGSIVGASSNIVAAGISELHGRRISFKTFLRYGVSITILQLLAVSLYLFLRFLL